MTDQLKSASAWILSLAAGVTAAAMTAASLPSRSGFDQALPIVAAALVLLCAASSLRTPGTLLVGDQQRLMKGPAVSPGPQFAAIGLALPLSIACEALIEPERLRHLSIGLVVAMAFAAAVKRATRNGFMPLPAAGAIGLLALSLARWIPLETMHVAAEVVIAAGVLLLMFALRKGDDIAVIPMLLATAVGFITPAVPGGAALFPLLCAGMVMAVEWESLVIAIPTLVLGAIASRSLFAIAALPLAVFALVQFLVFFRRPKDQPAAAGRPVDDRSSVGAPVVIALPLRLASWTAAARGLLFAPGAVALRSGAITAASASLIAFSLVVRPALAPLAVMAALLLTVPRIAQPRLAPVTFGMSILIIALVAWSGAAARSFPLPLPLPVLASIAGIAVCGMLSSVLAGAGAVVLIATAGILMPAPPIQSVGLGLSLTHGQRYEVELPEDVRSLSLIASGAAVSQLKPGTVLGRVELMASDGHRLGSRSISVGDVADWGFLRAEHSFSSRNALPVEMAGTLEGFGATAFLTGHGRIHLAAVREIHSLIFVADPALPGNARLQLSAIELPR